MNSYLLLKTLHISAVVLSITFFCIRTYWLLAQPKALESKLIKRLPHVIDSILLLSAFAMLYVGNISIGSDNPWIITKIIAISLYIATGVYIFRIAKNKTQIYIALCFVVLIYYYIIQTAITKNAIPFFN